jgi:hypothetical protein
MKFFQQKKLQSWSADQAPASFCLMTKSVAVPDCSIPAGAMIFYLSVSTCVLFYVLTDVF